VNKFPYIPMMVNDVVADEQRGWRYGVAELLLNTREVEIPVLSMYIAESNQES
jgi:hypothetical protein